MDLTAIARRRGGEQGRCWCCYLMLLSDERKGEGKKEMNKKERDVLEEEEKRIAEWKRKESDVTKFCKVGGTEIFLQDKGVCVANG